MFICLYNYVYINKCLYVYITSPVHNEKLLRLSRWWQQSNEQVWGPSVYSTLCSHPGSTAMKVAIYGTIGTGLHLRQDDGLWVKGYLHSYLIIQCACLSASTQQPRWLLSSANLMASVPCIRHSMASHCSKVKSKVSLTSAFAIWHPPASLPSNFPFSLSTPVMLLVFQFLQFSRLLSAQVFHKCYSLARKIFPTCPNLAKFCISLRS